MHTEQKWIVVRIDGKIAAISTDYRQLAAISSQLAETHRNGSASKPASGNKKGRKAHEGCTLYSNITATAVTLEDVLRIRQETQWDDMLLFGTDFQKKVWRKLWELTHQTLAAPEEMTAPKEMRAPEEMTAQEEMTVPEEMTAPTGLKESEDTAQTKGEPTQATRKELGKATLLSYSDFAELCNNKAGVRAVAHAIGLNPVSVIIPCHLVVPKESIDRIREIRRRAESTIFKGEDLCLDSILSDTAIDFGEYAQGKELKRILIMHDLK